MPKRKKLPDVPDYIGIENADKLTVQKSNPLQKLSETGMTLPEFKILDAYLARIDSHHPERRRVMFKKGELEKILDLARTHSSEMKKRIDKLFLPVEIKLSDDNKHFIRFSLFQEAEFFQEEDGQWAIALTCSRTAMKYIFNIENLGYLKYRLRNVIHLTSRYSYVLYLYLENNRFRKSWEISLEDLKKILNCAADTYDEYKRFNDLVLKKCYAEINEKTSLGFTYTAIRSGRRVTAVCFAIVPSDIETEPEAATESARAVYDEDLMFLSEACNNEFSLDEISHLRNMLVTVSIPETGHGTQIDRYHYLVHVYQKMNLESKKRKIKNRFSYMKKIIENERNT